MSGNTAVSLNRTGDQMPLIGYGCWKVDKKLCSNVVYEAIKAGYRLIDEAADYGNEKEAGEGIKRALDEKIIKRTELFVTSKLWNTYHRKEHVRTACLRSLKDLGIEYLDLYLIHFPISLKYVPFEVRYPPEWIHDPNSNEKCLIEDSVPYRETWEAMEELVKEGLVRNIGVSNLNSCMIKDLLSYAKIKPAVLQVELHPFLNQKRLVRYAHMNDIQVTAYSSFGAASYVELGGAKQSESILEHPLLIEIANRYGKNSGQVALRWSVQNKISCIPKTNNSGRLEGNQKVFDFVLTNEEMDAIDSLNKNIRYNDPAVYCEMAFGKFVTIFD